MGFRLEELCRLHASLDEVGRELLTRGVNGPIACLPHEIDAHLRPING